MAFSHSPDASVIITSFDRMIFLENAVKSALRQKVNSVEFEIIVIKNYSDSNIDRFLQENNVKNHISSEPDVAKFTLEAIERAKGKYVLLLDDDDEFLPEKIDYVANEFEENPNLIYLHNYFTEMSEDGKSRKNKLLKPSTEEAVLNTDAVSINGRKEFYTYFSYYNASCISLRKSDFLDLVEKYPEFIDGAPDHNFFILCCLSGKEVKITSKILNAYRVHGDSNTFALSKEVLSKKINKIQELKAREDKFKNTFIYPLVRDQRLEVQFATFMTSRGSVKVTLKDLLLYVYYSFKKRNRYALILSVLHYFRLLRAKDLSRISGKRKKRRLSFE